MTTKAPSLPLRVGLIGCGNISNAYFQHSKPFSSFIEIAACSDLDVDRAKAKAAEHGIKKAYSVESLLKDPEIDVVLNLTIPAAHAEVNRAALQAGKHAYCEKPFALTYEEGRRTVREAQSRKLQLGCAPDTVLGGGIQTCRKLIEDGAIGKPISAVANMLCHGHESWHPSPEFYYQVGGGPLFDMGPYYLSALINILGPIKNVMASASQGFDSRTITSAPLSGKVIKVETPTHLTGVLEFAAGTVATVTMSFDIWANHSPLLEIYGTEGSIQCPDPNWFNGDVLLWTRKNPEWSKVPLTHNGETGRGLGLADMADAIHTGRTPRASGEMGLHVVEAMESFLTSSREGRRITLQSTCPQPAAMAAGLPLGKLA